MNSSTDTILSIRNLSKRYPSSEQDSVKDISLDIYRKEIFGILGPNGAGKTTLISMLAGLVKPSGGDFHLNNKSANQDRNFIRKNIGIVPQEYALYPTLTAFENLQFFGALYGLKGRVLTEKIYQGLESVNLQDSAHKRVGQFSGGMKRRCNLLAGLLHNPQILFLDEPTVGVDVQSRAMIISLLQKINKQGTTLVYTSHHLGEAERLCTRIALMDLGQIHKMGKPQELISQTPFAQNLEDVFLSLTGKNMRDVV